MDEFVRKRGRPLGVDSKIYRYDVRLSKRDMEKLEMMAFDFDKSKSDILREAIELLHQKYYY